MDLTLTPKAAEKIRSIIAEMGSNLALRIQVRRALMGGVEWQMCLEQPGPDSVPVSGIPVVADKSSRTHLEGMVIDWVMTPAGPGFGIFDRSLVNRDVAGGPR